MSRRPRPVRSGERVLLRPPYAGDASEFVELRRASRAFLERWEPRLEDCDAFGPAYFERYLRSAATAEHARLLLCRITDDAILGHIGLGFPRPGPPGTAYVGYWIGVPYARQGYMREGLTTALDHLFEDLELHRVEANIQPDNAASIALVEGLGFRREGLSPKYLRIDGAWRDHVRYAILEDEWPVARTARVSRSTST